MVKINTVVNMDCLEYLPLLDEKSIDLYEKKRSAQY